MAARPPAGLRRTREALGKLASRTRIEVRPEDWRVSLIESQRKVIEHYRHVLARQPMPPAEREAILSRIARIEDEIRTMQGEGPPASTEYLAA